MSIISRDYSAAPDARARHGAIQTGTLMVTATCLIGLLAFTTAARSAPVCRPSDATVTRTVADLQRLVTSTAASDKAVKDSLRITATKATDVAYVTDERTCGKALTAFNTLMATPSLSRSLYVFKIGKDYAVEDPTVGQASEYRGLRIFGSGWAYNRTYLTY
jgi:hypothetical protein